MSSTASHRRDADPHLDPTRPPRPRSHSHSSSTSSRSRSRRSSRRSSKTTPERSTKTTLLYVLCLYLFYGILTRTDEFDHAIKHAAHSAAAGGRSLHHAGEAGYHVAHELMERSAGYPGIQMASNGMYTLPFPVRGPPSRNDHNLLLVVLARTATYGIVYPGVAIFNTVSFLLHYLSVSLVVLLYATHYLLLPLTQTLHLMGSTFFLAPTRLVLGIARLFYPAYVLLGGLLGIGTSLGLGLGWLGRRLEGAVHTRAAKKDEQRRAIEEERYRDALLEDRQRQIEEVEWARAASVGAGAGGAYAHPASRTHGTPFRPARHQRRRHRAPPATYDDDPAVDLPARRTRIKFAEPAASTAYYDSGDSSAESDYPDDEAHLVAYPRLHAGASGAPATSPSTAPGQAFHFHFHQPVTPPPAGARDIADEAPGMVGPAGSLLSHGDAVGSAVDGSPAAQGVRRRTRTLQDEYTGRVG